MDNIKKMISLKKIASVADYFNIYSKLQPEIGKLKFKNGKIKIAILSSFTIKAIKEILTVKCFEINLMAEFYVSDYQQYVKDILDKNGELYKFEPDLVILFIDIISILGKNYLRPYSISASERGDWAEEKFIELKSLISNITGNLSAKILVHNFEVPVYSPLGIVENKQDFGFIESIEMLNSTLRNTFKNDAQVYVFDYDAFCSKVGKQNLFDYKMYYLADIKIDLQKMPELCEEYLAYIKPLKSLNRKCIVVDLDNTLWGGVIGEDGLEGIKLGPTPEGRPFLEFQEYMLSLFERGIILAINSKNNLEDVIEVFKKHPYMILKEENFASMQINWNDKISNMKAIAEEIDIGIDSLVFLDDDKLSREIIKMALPEVLVVDMPEDHSLYVKTIMELNDLNTLQIVEEDKKRGVMYAQQRKRKELERTSSDITQYLKGLNMLITIEKANSFNIPRISQLTLKTNQFNMTTKRYLEEEIKKLANDNRFIVLSLQVEDKFGDNGITGAAIVEKQLHNFRIDTFLLSCRVIGRLVEKTMLAYIMNLAVKAKATTLIGEFIPTKKNAPAKDFYKDNGFRFVRVDGDKEIWEYDVSKVYKAPDFIKVVIK